MDAPSSASARIRIRIHGLDHRLVDQSAADLVLAGIDITIALM